MDPKSDNITWHDADLTLGQREGLLGQRGCVVWLTGLSGSGKSTVGRRAERMLLETGRWAYALDGDNLRHGLNADLGFGAEDRTENIRRVGHLGHLFAEAGCICLTAFISPYRADRARARALVLEGRFIEVHVSTPLAVCEARDPKGLYARARAGEIPNFTGISAPYEEPLEPEISVDTSTADVDTCARQLLEYLNERGFLTGGA